MPATARLVVQMSPEEKLNLDVRAREAGVTTSEFVRRRLGSDELTERREEIEALLDAIERTGPLILQHLDSAIEAANATGDSIDRITGQH